MQTLTNTGTVTLKRNAKAVYDLLAHKRIECPAKDGAISLQLSLKGAEGRLFLACDRELGALTAAVKRVDGGVEVSVATADKDIMVPIRVDGVGKKPFYGVIKGGVWRHTFAEATAEVRVTSLADGAVAKADCP